MGSKEGFFSLVSAALDNIFKDDALKDNMPFLVRIAFVIMSVLAISLYVVLSIPLIVPLLLFYVVDKLFLKADVKDAVR